MVESAPASSLLPEDLGLSFPLPSAALSVCLVPGLRVVSLRHLAGGAAGLDAVAAAHGLAQLPGPGTFRGTDPWWVWTGPAEFLLLTTGFALAQEVCQALAPGRDALACALDQSAGCLVLELKGPGVAHVLQQLLDVNAVPGQAGQGSRTRLMDIGAVVLRLEHDRTLLVIDRAHGVYVSHWIKHASDGTPLR
jgi:heterotetrameric sarcosine oxidase gamma subunit